MSKSTKQPIFNDYGYAHKKRVYRRSIRRTIKNYLTHCEHLGKYDEMLNPPHMKTLINDYDWCDWRYDHRKNVCYGRNNGYCSSWNKALGSELNRDKICEDCRKRYSRK